MVLSTALLLLFVALPVAKALVGAVQDEAGAWSLSALGERLGQARVWGLGCLNLASEGGGVRCDVAWNTLFLALLTATGTTVLGTLIALLAERGSRRLARPLNLLALLPMITPPFVVGLGLILLFGHAGLVNQALVLAKMKPASAPAPRWTWWAWRASTSACHPSCRVASSSGWRWPGRWCCSRR